MENKQNSKKQTLIHIALVVGGFVAGSVIWGNGSNIMNSNDSANESVNKKQIELANSINALAQTANQVNKPAGLVLTEQDKELIGKTAAQYLIEHPENLVEAGKRLEANRDGEKTSDVVNTKDVLLETKFTPNYGPDNADVAVIEFFDYMCHFCQQSSPVLEKAIAENKNVRTFFKDFTIFADRTPISGMGAKIGLYINKFLIFKGVSMLEHNIVFNSMMIMIVILSYMLFKILKSKKRLQHKYDEVFKAFHIADSEYTGGLKDVYKNLSLSNAQLQFLAVYFNQDTVQFDGRNIVCEKEDDVQYILSLISDSHFWLDKSMKGINEVVNNTDVIKDIKLSLSPFASLGELKVIDDEFKLKNKEFDGFAKLKVKYDVKRG